jgi:3-deoxy-D-manno-octulosonate 8-phosphate phosphatase (KDO 8-P phosphatase)
MEEKLKKIECILCDADGTLTDGGVLISASKEQFRNFSIKDGLGIYIWRNQGFKFGLVTGDKTGVVAERGRMLRADYVYSDCMDKGGIVEEIIQKSGLKPENIAFIGDDLIDIPAFKRVGFSVSVADGVPELDNCIDLRTKSRGGFGAVREVIELILKAKGKWENIVDEFHKE